MPRPAHPPLGLHLNRVARTVSRAFDETLAEEFEDLAEYRAEILDEFRALGADLLGISVDGAWCHAAYAKHNNLSFPLLADFEPKGAVARAYGVYDEKTGTSERALFVIDKKGIIAWSYCSPIAVNPGADGILEALESLPKQEKMYG